MKLSLKNISVKFSHKVVLDNLNIDFEEGKLHALLGENGAGKSTTANIICGELISDEGSVYLNDEKINLKNPKDAINHKICYVHQRPIVAETISITENLKLGLKKNQFKKIPELLNKWLPESKKNKPVSDCSADEKFFIAFISALLKEPEILILDEPTALLEKTQKEFLFTNLKELAKQGMNIIVITHDIDDAKKYFDTITCLQNGSVIQSENYFSKFNLEPQSPSLNGKDENQTKLKIDFLNINCKPLLSRKLKDINFTCESGKITLIEGRPEDGLSTLEDVITGFYNRKKTGQIIITKDDANKCFKLNKNFTPGDIRFNLGIKTGIIPTNRKFRGSYPFLNIDTILQRGINHSEDYSEKLIDKAKINIQKTEPAANLSGGMLQRLIIAREFSENPDFLILCNPMQGLDSATCSSLINQIVEICNNGTSVLVLSTGDFPSQLSHFHYTLKEGELI